MTQKFVFSLFLIFTITGYAQNNVKGTSFSHFELKSKKDTIDFVVADTNLSIRKPILLFCQGSQPKPLFIDFDEEGIFPVPLSNFNLKALTINYHVVVISMPNTPLIVGKEHLNKQYNYITDTTDQHSYSTAYLQADYAENYVRRANKALRFLAKQKWVDPSRLVVVGHSQGARIAVGIANSNKHVTDLGLFGYNPNGRVDQSIRQIRKNAEEGKISWETADSLQQEQYRFYELIQNPDSIVANPSLTSWKSFSKPTIHELVQLKIPVYIAYGSEDIVADFCDLLPLYFMEAKKKDYFLKRYPGLDHNFFPVREDGSIDYNHGQWEFVMSAFLNWIPE